MKKNFVYLLSMSVCILGMASCGGTQKSNEETAKQEEAAVVAGSATKSLLTEELKAETIELMKDMPDSEIPYRLYSGEVKLSIGDMSYMLPVSKAAELNTQSQKARACGMYFADYNILRATEQPVGELQNILVKLTSDLNIAFVQDIMKEHAPENISKEEFREFAQKQENRLIDAMAQNDKMDVQLEILGGMAAENACLVANPSLIIEGDATSAGLSENMEGRIKILGEIAKDMAAYYPELNEMREIMLPLRDKVTTVSTARANNAEILAIRDALLK